MSGRDPQHASAGAGRSHFATTHWSVVLAAGQDGSPEARAALSTLCETYWYPLYAYVRRRGYAADDAQDLTQAFFAALLGKGYLQAADLGTTEGAVKVAVHRLRRRYRERLRSEIAHTLAHPGEVDDELTHLLAALRGEEP